MENMTKHKPAYYEILLNSILLLTAQLEWSHWSFNLQSINAYSSAQLCFKYNIKLQDVSSYKWEFMTPELSKNNKVVEYIFQIASSFILFSYITIKLV